MACYQVVKVSVEFKAENKEILFSALKSLSMSFSYVEENNTIFVGDNKRIKIDFSNKKVETEDYRMPTVNAIKRAYAEECLKLLQKKRWVLKRQGNNEFTFNRY